MKKTSRQLVDEATSQINTLSVDQAHSMLDADNILFVDLREKGELHREGKVPGALSAPRGLLEFWVDPESPYFNQAFAGDPKLVLFCGLGWRSALATKALQDMGFDNVCHIEGGFTAWRAAGAPVEGGPDAPID